MNEAEPEPRARPGARARGPARAVPPRPRQARAPARGSDDARPLRHRRHARHRRLPRKQAAPAALARRDRASRAPAPPVLFVPAPVSRYFIIDLLPGRSFAGHVAAAGFDVYIADFGTPSREDRFADLAYYVDGLVRRSCARWRADRRSRASTSSATASAARCRCSTRRCYPETVARLVLLTTTVDGDVEGGIPWVAHRMGLAGESYDNPRLVPAAEVKSWFEMLAPGSNSLVGRVSDLWDRLDDAPERLRDVRTMATWVDDVVPAPGRLLAELYRKFGPGANGLMTGTADGRRPAGRLRAGHDAGAVGVGREGHDRAARGRRCDSHDRAARRGLAPAGRARRHRRRPRGRRRCGSARSSSWARRRSRVERELHPWRGHRICVSERGEGKPLLLVPGLGCSADMWAAVHGAVPESPAHQLRRAGHGTLEHAALSRARRGARRRSRPPCSTTAASSAPTSSASRTAAPSRSSSRTTIPSASAASCWPRPTAAGARSGARRRRWP